MDDEPDKKEKNIKFAMKKKYLAKARDN